MKITVFHLVIFINLLISPFYCISQTTAYPSVNNSKVFGASCADLHYVNPVVIGHQQNVTVSYYETLNDAQNEINILDRFYEPLSDPQTIYARVDNQLDNSFDIAESIVDTAPVPGGPPPGISSYYFDICDVDMNGSELVYLDNLRALYEGYAFPTTSFCASQANEIITTYYLTETDAMNETNPVNSIYSLTGTQNFYRKIKNINTNEFLIDDMLNVTVVTCTADTDMDGISDLVEDVNRNLLNTDDDTDQDGLKNFEDNDDDGDGILTIDEDYNNNGDPTDDDTNLNGIADYLELNVTLNTVDLLHNKFNVYPNPANTFINIKSNSLINTIEIYNSIGQLLISETNKTKIDLSKFASGLLIIKIKDINGQIENKKIIKE